MNGSLDTTGDRHTLRFERRLDHSVERVWRTITEPDELSHWFPPEEALEVTESDPPRLLTGTWFGDELRFELTADGDGCLLVFTHTFEDRDTAARSAAGWDRCLAALDALLAGQPITREESLEGWLEIHDRYADEFGVDPELGRQAYEDATSES